MSSCQKNIGILGASGHIGKNLTEYLQANTMDELLLFGRNPDKIKDFLWTNNIQEQRIKIDSLDNFPNHDCDVIINAVGPSSPKELRENPGQVFEVTENYDNRVLEYLQKHDQCRYIFLSSGAVYGKDFEQPAHEETEYRLKINQLVDEDLYAIAKINCEAKHRSLQGFQIIDVRVFNFVSRYLDISAGFMVGDMVSALKSGQEFITNSVDMVRDYIHPEDLGRLVLRCIDVAYQGPVDAYSREPVSKFQVLDLFVRRFGLKYAISDQEETSGTGFKKNYFSLNRTAERLGCGPKYSSLQTLLLEVPLLLKEDNH